MTEGLRRMFAGGRVSRHGPLRAGAEATRRTWQAGATVKQGRAGTAPASGSQPWYPCSSWITCWRTR
jgi:hypothetical protein